MAKPTLQNNNQQARSNIQWYPGHMAKARRMLEANLKLVDAVCELVDARIPRSSRNPDIDALTVGKPRLVILNRTDQADPAVTALWRAYFTHKGLRVLETDAKSGRGVSGFSAAVRAVLKDRLAAYAAKGQANRPLRAMVVGIPNVGKSTFINKAARRKAAMASDRPGVTRGKQWITVDARLELLDTPGLLWPRIDSPDTGEALAWTGAVKDEITDREALAGGLLARLHRDYPERLGSRYGIPEAIAGHPHDFLALAAKNRGFLVSGGEYDTERMAAVVLDEFRGGKLGRISLERPEDEDDRRETGPVGG